MRGLGGDVGGDDRGDGGGDGDWVVPRSDRVRCGVRVRVEGCSRGDILQRLGFSKESKRLDFLFLWLSFCGDLLSLFSSSELPEVSLEVFVGVRLILAVAAASVGALARAKSDLDAIITSCSDGLLLCCC